MSLPTDTLADLLFNGHDAAVRSIHDGLVEARQPGWSPVAKLAGEHLAHVAQSIAGLLATPVADLLLGAWDATTAVRKAQRTTQGRPDAVESITLVSQTLPLTRRVQLWVESQGVESHIGDVVFTGELLVGFVTVTVRDGRTTNVTPVQVSGAARVGLAGPGASRVQPLAAGATPTVDLGARSRWTVDQPA